MHYVILFLLLVSAHFSLTPFAPAPANKGSFYWPFSAETKPWLPTLGGLPQAGGLFTALAAGAAGLCFLAACLGSFGWLIPAAWVRPLVFTACGASLLLYAAYLGPRALIPLAIDAFLVWSTLTQTWVLKS